VTRRYMKRVFPSLVVVIACAVVLPTAGADEVRIEQLRQDVRELNRVVREQARQIERLEREIERLKAASTAGRPRSAQTAAADLEVPWLASGRWKKVVEGMSEAEVVALLGPPTAVRGEPPASKTLLYTLELEGTGFLSGSVRLENGRVQEISEPQLR
jgi:hypothetical protein